MNFNQGTAGTYTKKKQNKYGLSGWFKVGQQSVELYREKTEPGIPWPFRNKTRYEGANRKVRFLAESVKQEFLLNTVWFQ